MSVFAQAARIISTLAGLSQQGAGLGLDLSGWTGSNPNAESIAGTGTSMGGDLGALAFSLGAKSLVTQISRIVPDGAQDIARRNLAGGGAKSFGKSLNIIGWALTVVDFLELTTGFGSSYEGDNLKTGSQQFAAVVEQLKSAIPGEDWQGEASQAYASQDTVLQDVALQLAALDLQLAALVKDQADWVTHMRLGFGIVKDVLLAALVIEIILLFTVPPPAGPIASKAFAITVAALGIAAAASFIGVLLYYSITNGQKADALTTQYNTLAERAQLPGTFAEKTKVAAADRAHRKSPGVLAEIPHL